MSTSVDALLLHHFGLRENPFGVTPDPRFLFMSRTHREALASLVNGIDCGFGFQVLVAQPGMGKTTLLFDFLERFNTSSRTAFLFQQQDDPREFLRSLLLELKIDTEETSQAKQYGQLNDMLSQAGATGKRVIVVVDEAQNLGDELLETLRQLSNFETARSKLLQIVLAGQTQLAKTLARPGQEQLRQRISSIARLSPLGLDETRSYLTHRLNIAGYRGPEFFTRPAIQMICSTAQGIPRNMNTLCFNAMLLAFAQRSKRVDEHEVREAAQDLDLDYVLADVAGSHPFSRGSSLRVVTSGIALPERKSNSTQQSACLPTPPSNSGPLAVVTPTAKSVTEPVMANVSNDGKQIPQKPTLVLEPTVPQATSVQVSTLAIAEAAASSAPISVANLPRPPNGALRPKPIAAVPPSKRPVAVTGNRTSAGTKALGTLVIALAVGIGVLFGHGLGTHAQQRMEQRAEASPPPPMVQDPPATSDAPQAAAAKGTSNEPHWNANDGPEIVVRTFPQTTPAPLSGAQPNVKAIFFEGDSSEVPSEYHMTLQHIAQILTSDPQSTAILEGHTDDSGEESYNLDLSVRRAIAVKSVLVHEYRISPERLSTTGEGSASPLESNSTSSGRAYNRRVEVRIRQAAN